MRRLSAWVALIAMVAVAGTAGVVGERMRLRPLERCEKEREELRQLNGRCARDCQAAMRLELDRRGAVEGAYRDLKARCEWK